MNKNIFKRFIGFFLAIVMVVGCALSLTGCGKQETATAQEETLIGTVWVADYFVNDSFGKLTLEESIEQGYLEDNTSYTLEFIDEDSCIFRMLHKETISSEDELSYAFQSGNLSFADSDITEATYSSADGITITHLIGGDKTIFHFVRNDNVVQNTKIDNTANTIQTEEQDSIDESGEQANSANDIEWLDFFNDATTGNGYELNEHLHISKWISADDTTTLEAAWAEVGKGHEFPSETQLGYGSGTYSTVDGVGHMEYDGMYYAIGYLEVTNVTDDFAIDTNNTLTYNFGLWMPTKFEPCHLLLSYSDSNHLYYCNYGQIMDGSRNPINYTMKSDHWGSVPIVIALPVDRSPNYPEGNPSPAEATFSFGDTEFTLG